MLELEIFGISISLISFLGWLFFPFFNELSSANQRVFAAPPLLFSCHPSSWILDTPHIIFLSLRVCPQPQGINLVPWLEPASPSHHCSPGFLRDKARILFNICCQAVAMSHSNPSCMAPSHLPLQHCPWGAGGCQNNTWGLSWKQEEPFLFLLSPPSSCSPPLNKQDMLDRCNNPLF